MFKNGNSLAVRIPKELAIVVDLAQEVDIERVGNALMVRRVEQQSLAGTGQTFAMFSADFMAEGREFHEERNRNWPGLDKDIAASKV